MHFIIILVLLTVAIASPALTRTAQVCSNVLNVKQIAMTNQNQIIALCSSNVDSNEPILVYDLLTNTSHPITKNSKELVSIFYFEPNNMNILFGTRNSTIYQYEMPTGKISWDLKSPQPNVIVQGIYTAWKQKFVVWVGNDGKLCATNPTSNKTSCALAHAFNATVVYVHPTLDQIFTCGGDRMCRLWRFEMSSGSFSLLKSFSLSKISKVSMTTVSTRRVVVAGIQGFESFAVFQAIDKVNYIHGGPALCVFIAEQWGHMLTLSPSGTLSVIELYNGGVVTQYQFGQKIISCYFVNLNTLVTGHEKGQIKIWKY